MLYCISIPHLACLSTCGRTLRLLPFVDCCQYCCREHRVQVYAFFEKEPRRSKTRLPPKAVGRRAVSGSGSLSLGTQGSLVAQSTDRPQIRAPPPTSGRTVGDLLNLLCLSFLICNMRILVPTYSYEDRLYV